MPAELAAPSFTPEVLVYGLLVLGVFGVLWIFYDRRDRAFYDAGRRKISFHCIRCDHLYTQPTGTETAACPKCGHENVRLKF
ncbi:MAG: hydrogenase nickel incorporation protein HypA [Opitutus sp.]|nr:hydrogenase nickel incorporation protein HypA [Opitutus sp.]